MHLLVKKNWFFILHLFMISIKLGTVCMSTKSFLILYSETSWTYSFSRYWVTFVLSRLIEPSRMLSADQKSVNTYLEMQIFDNLASLIYVMHTCCLGIWAGYRGSGAGRIFRSYPVPNFFGWENVHHFCQLIFFRFRNCEHCLHCYWPALWRKPV